MNARGVAWLLGAALSLAGARTLAQANPGDTPGGGASTTPPRLLHFVEATYPPDALSAGRAASVLLEITIDATGRVTQVQVVGSAGPAFDVAAVNAVGRFEFAPARRDGEPVPVRIRYRYRFTPVVRPATVERPPSQVRPVAPPVNAAPPPAPRPAPSDDESGVVVTARRPPREVTRQTIERDEIVRSAGTGGDALRSIQNLPGLARPPFAGGDLVVRGSSPDDTAVFVDGMDLPLLYHFAGLTSTIPTEMLERIDFYPGNFSARYGRAMGGVVDVGLRSPRHRGYHAVATVSAIDAGIFAEGAITSNLSFAIAARRSWVAEVLQGVLEQFSGVGLVAAPVYYDYQALLEWRPTPRDRVRLAVLGDDDTLKLLFQNQDFEPTIFSGTFAFATRYALAQLLWTHTVSAQTEFRAMISAGWTNTEFRGGDQFSYSDTSYPVDVRYEISHTLAPFLRVHAGVDIQAASVNLKYAILRFDPADASADPLTSLHVASSVTGTILRPAMYLEAEARPLTGLRLIPGLRLDYTQETREATLSPRLAARYDVCPGFALKGGVGLFTQMPFFDQSSGAPNNIFPGQTIGNPALLSQRAMHYAFGFEIKWHPTLGATLRGILGANQPELTLSVEGFYKALDHLIVATPTLELLSQPPPVPYTNAGTGRVFGLEILARIHATSRLFGWVAYTLMRAERSDGPGQPYHVYDYDQTHILTVLAGYELGWGVNVGFRFRYVTGLPSTPVIGAYYSADSMQYVAISGDRNSQRVGDFHQLDLRIEKVLRFGWGRLSAFLEVINVYNHANPEGVQYNYNYTQQAPINGLPIFPNLGVRGEL